MGASLVAQMANSLPRMQGLKMKPFEWKVEDYLGILQKKEKATHSSILTCKIPRTEEPGGLQSMGSQKAGHD